MIYSWDDELPEDQRVHTLDSISKCEFHQALSDSEAYDSVLKENQIKNNVLGHVQENYPDLVDVKSDGSKELKLGYAYDWSFDVDRILQAEIIGVDKATAQAISDSVALDVKIDSEKVDVKIP